MSIFETLVSSPSANLASNAFPNDAGTPEWIDEIHQACSDLFESPEDRNADLVRAFWDHKLGHCVIRDLRTASKPENAYAPGKRIHFWATQSCMIIYVIKPLPAVLRFSGFHQMDDDTVMRDLGLSFLRQFTVFETWVYCPALEGVETDEMEMGLLWVKHRDDMFSEDRPEQATAHINSGATRNLLHWPPPTHLLQPSPAVSSAPSSTPSSPSPTLPSLFTSTLQSTSSSATASDSESSPSSCSDEVEHARYESLSSKQRLELDLAQIRLDPRARVPGPQMFLGSPVQRSRRDQRAKYPHLPLYSDDDEEFERELDTLPELLYANHLRHFKPSPKDVGRKFIPVPRIRFPKEDLILKFSVDTEFEEIELPKCTLELPTKRKVTPIPPMRDLDDPSFLAKGPSRRMIPMVVPRGTIFEETYVALEEFDRQGVPPVAVDSVRRKRGIFGLFGRRVKREENTSETRSWRVRTALLSSA